MTNRFPAELTLLSSILPFSVDSMSIFPALLSIVFPIIFPFCVETNRSPAELAVLKLIVPSSGS